MRCDLVRANLQDLMEKRLPAPKAAEIRLHLATCGDCAAELESWQNLWSSLAGLAPCRTAPDLAHGILADLGQASDLPRGLVLLFTLASLGTFGGLSVWVEGLQIERSLVSACFWAIAGAVSVLSIWFAVERSHQSEPMVAQEE